MAAPLKPHQPLYGVLVLGAYGDDRGERPPNHNHSRKRASRAGGWWHAFAHRIAAPHTALVPETPLDNGATAERAKAPAAMRIAAAQEAQP
jgi:hypothetical protein